MPDTIEQIKSKNMALEENTWIIDLESALMESCSAETISRICNGKPVPVNLRSRVWQSCLDCQNKSNQMNFFHEIFDLPEQNQLRNDCKQVVASLGNDDDDKVSVVSDLESILTHYCKSKNVHYEKSNGWIEILLPILSLKLPMGATYHLFEAIKHKYIPRGCRKNGSPFHLFRLLLLYHDPELCSFLDTMRISPDMYCTGWFQSLFASTCTLGSVLAMWDLYFQQRDQFFIFYLALVMVVNARDQILSMKNENTASIVDTLTNMPCALESDDVSDFCSLAQYYALKTPSSFKKDLHEEIFVNEQASSSISQSLCLPVSVTELVHNADALLHSSLLDSQTEGVKFFLVDSRPSEQYNSGHLPTAFHLDCNLMLQEPSSFATAVQALLASQRQALATRSAFGGEHLCFLGSGRLEEDQYTHMVVASFLQKHTHFISMVSGGYHAIHEYFNEDVNKYLEDHNEQNCIVCEYKPKQNKTEHLQTNHNSSVDFLGKISTAMRLKSAEVKGRLFDYIVNPTGSNSGNLHPERHVSSTDKLGKRYRNIAPVFSIDDEHDEDSGNILTPEEKEGFEVVSLSSYLDNPDLIKAFKCKECKVNGYTYDSHLLLMTSYIVVLRDMIGKKGFAHVVARRSLSDIVRITSKKHVPKVITFMYGSLLGEQAHVTDIDKFFIPKATEATQLVKIQILKNLNLKDC